MAGTRSGHDWLTPKETTPSWRTTMNIRAAILTSVLSLPLVAAAALAADTGNPSLVNAAKQGDRDAVRSILNDPAKKDVAGAEGGAALILAASHNDVEMADLLLRAGADPKAANEYGATALYAAADSADPTLTKKLQPRGADHNRALHAGPTPVRLAAA